MTSRTDELIRAFLADEARHALAMAPSLDEAVGQLAPRIGGQARADSRRLMLLVAASLLLVAAIGSAIAIGSGVIRLPWLPTSPFEGTWISTSDGDGGTQTMTVQVTGIGIVEIAVRDTQATVCDGTASTMTGTGRIDGDMTLVIPTPTYACDDGTEAQTLNGPSLEEQLHNWTLVLNLQTDTLSDGIGGLWLREGAPGPTLPPSSSGSRWPQTTLADMQTAQAGADAGDPAYTWQLAPGFPDTTSPQDAGIIDRFIHDQLGWEAYAFNPLVGWEEADKGLVYVRCAPDEVNPLYPNDERYGHCAPTIDELRYETVSIDLYQPIRSEPTGIWVVDRWQTTSPFAQTDPNDADTRARSRLEAFLAARVAGQGAEGILEVSDAVDTVPLLYGTSTGAPFERYEIERVGGPDWPYGNAVYTIRLFADGGATVVEQPVILRDGGLSLDAAGTTENGQPLAVTYSFFEGAVTFVAAEPWKVWGGLVDWGALFTGEAWNQAEGMELALCDPSLAPENAQALADNIKAVIGEAATAPLAVTVGGVEGFLVDASIDTEVSVCGGRSPSLEVVTRSALADGIRIRYYLLDLPDGASPRILVLSIAAPEARIDAVIEAAAPIIESIEFQVP